MDKQNAMRALAGGPTAGPEYIKQLLEDVKEQQQAGCDIREQWTPSHLRIWGNERADTLAQEGTTKEPCVWTHVTLYWMRSRPHHLMTKEWQARHNLRTPPPPGPR